jgi:hypothetical protein
MVAKLGYINFYVDRLEGIAIGSSYLQKLLVIFVAQELWIKYQISSILCLIL